MDFDKGAESRKPGTLTLLLPNGSFLTAYSSRGSGFKLQREAVSIACDCHIAAPTLLLKDRSRRSRVPQHAPAHPVRWHKGVRQHDPPILVLLRGMIDPEEAVTQKLSR